MFEHAIMRSSEITATPVIEPNTGCCMEQVARRVLRRPRDPRQGQSPLRLAAAHLPKVDAIGGSAAGVYVDSKVRAASLFRGVPNELFSEHVENIFFEN